MSVKTFYPQHHCQTLLEMLFVCYSGISFIPREAGEHLVSIMKDGEHVSNSPISLSISQAEIGNASKVKAFGSGLHTGHTFCKSEFVVDTWDAGIIQTSRFMLYVKATLYNFFSGSSLWLINAVASYQCTKSVCVHLLTNLTVG